MSSAVLLLLIPLVWLAVATFIVAACRVTAQADAEVPGPPVGGAGGLGAVSPRTVPCRSEIGPCEQRGLGSPPQPSPAALVLVGGPHTHASRLRRQGAIPAQLGMH